MMKRVYWLLSVGLTAGFRLRAEEMGEAALDPRGLMLALTGVLIVFAGLVAISIFIALLPKVLKTFQCDDGSGGTMNTRPVRRESVGRLDEATLAAITLVLNAEAEREAGQNLKVTLGLNPSPWALSSHMRVIPGRINS